jgi:hypothetical protein
MTTDQSDERRDDAEPLDRLWNPEREASWRSVLTGENPILRKGWRFRRLFPATDRCKNCSAPFTGVGAFLMRRLGRGQYNRNPRFCDF